MLPTQMSVAKVKKWDLDVKEKQVNPKISASLVMVANGFEKYDYTMATINGFALVNQQSVKEKTYET